MAAGSNIQMLPTVNGYLQGLNGNSEDNLQRELEMILQTRNNQRVSDRERSFDIHRSGSAPPTVEGSLNAVGSLYKNCNFSDVNGIASGSVRGNNAGLTEDEIRSHPAYLSYYYSHEHINPRLPPPLLSKEDWRVVQRFQSSGSQFEGVGNLRKYKAVDDGDSSSLFSMQPGLPVHKVDKELMGLRNSKSNNLSRNASAEGLNRGSEGFTELQCSRLGARRKSLDDVLQEGNYPASLSRHPSSPASHNACSHLLNTTGACDPHQGGLHDHMESSECLHNGAASPGLTGVQSHGGSFSQSFGTAMDSSLSRSTTPEQHPVGRSPSSIFPPVGCRIRYIEKNGVGMNFQNDQSSGTAELGEIASTLSGLSLSSARLTNQESETRHQLQMDLHDQLDFPCNMSSGCTQTLQRQQLRENPKAANLSFSTNYSHMARKNGVVPNLNAFKTSSNGDVSITRRTSSSSNLRSKMNTSGHGSSERSNLHYRNANIPVMDFTGRVPGDCSVNHKMKSVINNHLDAGSALVGNGIGHGLNRSGNQVRPDLHSPAMDPRYTNYLQRISAYATHSVAGVSDPPVRNYFSLSDGDFDGIQKACLETLPSQQKQQYKLPLLAKSGNLNLNLGYHSNSLHGLSMPYMENLMPNSVLPSVGSGSFLSEQAAHFASMVGSPTGGSLRSNHFDIDCNAERRNASTLLDEFKSNKTRSLALSDIVGHVFEFSTDQHGSRFIQQKLETATVEEKDKIFPEIIPHARTLMTDVFGNYVIQKFLDHGTESQRTELASQLTGHVLPLSFQMYGCRVIQKALEMIGVDQQTQLVAELDGSVMKCIHDQNGNHVIQKCIECIPEDRIQFIISAFYEQVVTLSTHPYGCRVIQRVLEHSKDMNTQKIIMEEIMQSVCSLAQDQYGNYVIQHVLEHGKPQERSAIISKLAGQIVMMSQQKFASNVVEKCLTFGGPKERQLLVNEILGSTDENEPLQVMMKDPFGNYVVQKVLETCNDQNLELILSRIRIHLSSLKKYTYGKHIVSRVEKLITTGEKRIGSSSSVSSKTN